MQNLYQVIRGAISADTCELLKNTIMLEKDLSYWEHNVPADNRTAFGDPQSPISYCTYNSQTCNGLLLMLLPLMEQVTGKKLYPTYTYARIYWPGSTLRRHVDRPACEYSATICVSNDPAPWPIYMGEESIDLEPGDLVIYKGCEIQHGREPYQGNQQIQIFVHTVDADGPHAHLKYDRRPNLGFPREEEPAGTYN